MPNKDGLAELVKLVERFENLDDAILNAEVPDTLKDGKPCFY